MNEAPISKIVVLELEKIKVYIEGFSKIELKFLTLFS